MYYFCYDDNVTLAAVCPPTIMFVCTQIRSYFSFSYAGYYYVFHGLLGMDQNDLQGERREMKYKGKNVVWSVAMDKCLIESLAIQARNGNKIDKCFNENAYTAACVAVNSRFNLSLNNQKVVNRLKTIKKRYKIMRDMLSQDGFIWNPNTKMIECDNDDLWKRYIAVSIFCLFFFF